MTIEQLQTIISYLELINLGDAISYFDEEGLIEAALPVKEKISQVASTDSLLLCVC